MMLSDHYQQPGPVFKPAGEIVIPTWLEKEFDRTLEALDHKFDGHHHDVDHHET